MVFSGKIFLQELLRIVIKGIIEVTAVMAFTVTITYTGIETVEANGEVAKKNDEFFFSSINNSSHSKKKLLDDWWGNGFTYNDRKILLELGYSDKGCFYTAKELRTALNNYYLEKAPGKPTKDDGFEPKKSWDGETLKKELNSQKRGYPAKDGSLWVPSGENSNRFNNRSSPPYWIVQYPNGSYKNIFPSSRKKH